MKASYNLDIDDMMSFQDNYYSTSKNFFKLKLFNSLIWPAFITILALIFVYFKWIDKVLLIIIGIGDVFIFLKIYIGFKKYYLKTIKKNIETSDTKNILGDVLIDLSNDYLTIYINWNEEKIKWWSLYNVCENEHYFYLYIAEYMAHILPKKKISNIEWWTSEEFFEYIQTHSKKSIA